MTNGHGKIRRTYFTIFVLQHSVTRQENGFSFSLTFVKKNGKLSNKRILAAAMDIETLKATTLALKSLNNQSYDAKKRPCHDRGRIV